MFLRFTLELRKVKDLHSHSENDHTSQCAWRDNGKFRWYFRANFGNITRTSIIKMSSPAPEKHFTSYVWHGRQVQLRTNSNEQQLLISQGMTDSWRDRLKSTKEGPVLATAMWTLMGPTCETSSLENQKMFTHKKNCVFSRRQKANYPHC